MSAFKLPSIPKMPVSMTNQNSDEIEYNHLLGKEFPRFSWGDIEHGMSIGQGSFGAVSLCEHKGQKVVIKKLLSEDKSEKDIIVKEARLLHEIKSSFIVKLEGICLSPCALMLEYLRFDFRPFGGNESVNSLDKFLKYVDQSSLIDEISFSTKIAKDIADGVNYLHTRDIVHRDIKPANVPVSNQHYCNLKGRRQQQKYVEEPIIPYPPNSGRTEDGNNQHKAWYPSLPSTGAVLRSQA
ncbi:receptor-interacting serine/threonine-protein kinase 1 [Exaiptasia diaphana]|uniref:Protein kinase domain-containing protein n=1 Tax=Exaiptasia diaphana TaxID=2652724 RepID=A0A913XXF8_EXADI|nr:receptor-interacting serine/threonine-protein kinase 1 [Exaiptasia diaphana]